MAEYKRFVSYLYEYQNNKKSQNCGFCRAELRDHNCRLEIHLKLSIYPFTPVLKVYVFVPSKEKLYGIFLGNASYQQGNVSGSFSFSETNIQNTTYQFSQLGGIFIQTDMGTCFASAWKDLNIQPENFLSEQPSFCEKNEKKFVEPSMQKNFHSEKNNCTSCFPSSDAENPLDKPKAESNQSDVDTLSALSDKTENLSNSTKQEKDFQDTSETRTTDITEASTETNKEESCQQNPEQESFSYSEETTLLAASTDSSDNFWEMILKSYPQCHPFFDDEIHNCVQLSPNDVQKLTAVGYPICNNPFFRHNCQSFQHFLIGKKTCRTDTCNTHYILAVPGIYNSKEQYMASMFGFPHFKCGQNALCQNNCWGYWYRILPEHWENCKF